MNTTIRLVPHGAKKGYEFNTRKGVLAAPKIPDKARQVSGLGLFSICGSLFHTLIPPRIVYFDPEKNYPELVINFRFPCSMCT